MQNVAIIVRLSAISFAWLSVTILIAFILPSVCLIEWNVNETRP